MSLCHGRQARAAGRGGGQGGHKFSAFIAASWLRCYMLGLRGDFGDADVQHASLQDTGQTGLVSWYFASQPTFLSIGFGKSRTSHES